MTSSQRLAARYEQLREQVVHGGHAYRGLGMSVVLRQGVWAWMILAAAQDRTETARHGVVPPTAIPPPAAPAVVSSELLAAWTDLVVSAVTYKEAS